MTSGVLTVVVPALIGLFGTMLGLWIGQRRWYVEHRLARRRAFDASRYGAYQKLWEVVESAHIKIRVELPDRAQVEELQRNINVFRHTLDTHPVRHTLVNHTLDSHPISR